VAPLIASVHFDDGKLRFPRGQGGKNSRGAYVLTAGYLRGTDICTTDNDFFAHNYDVNVQTPNSKKKWSGRIIRKLADPNGIDTNWVFVLVNSQNDPDPDSLPEEVTVTVTNPVTGPSPSQPTQVTLDEIP
jgi:hypothetical protein